jgi:glycosidase
LNNLKQIISFFTVAIILLATACQNAATKTASANKQAMKVPDWAKNATIYELNIRQFSKEGTFAKATAGLKDIKGLGIDIIWVMPIFPISEKNRKCNEKETTECWGSHYAATSFKEVHPRYGTKDDFRAFMKEAHALGLKVILDFVPDHTGWDCKWITEHPEYYVKIDGKITTPIDPVSKKPTDWNDVAMLDYSNKGLRAAIIDAHRYWITEFGVDGYREDVAGFVQDDFWTELRSELDKIKPVFMLAEWGDNVNQLKTCFQMNYGWTFHFLLKDIAKGKKNADSLETYFKTFKTKFPKESYQMQFTQNHDENTWNGTERESFGDAGDLFTALCFTADGMGEIYNGQEVSLDKRLSFFHKDQIDWAGKSRRAFISALTGLKHHNKAVWNGAAGGELKRISTNNNQNIFAFTREKEGDKIVCIFNLSAKPQDITLKGGDFAGTFKNILKNNTSYDLKANANLKFGAWECLILSTK